jgi:Flp pilus assembly protein TadD
MLYLKNKGENESFELRRSLEAAEGYLYLRMPKEALGELDGVEPRARQHPGVMRARIRVLLHLKRWQDAESLSSKGAKLYPDENEFVVQRAFALHQLRKVDDAADALNVAPEWLRRTGILHYNLACYEAQLGDLSTARQCIFTAIELNAAFKKNAQKDPDLAEIWN